MILCLYKICACVVADAVRLCILQSIVFPNLIILFTITKLLLPLDANIVYNISLFNIVLFIVNLKKILSIFLL